MDDMPQKPKSPPLTGGGHIPRRRPVSVRRTTSIDTHWPHGRDQPAEFDARSRDAATDQQGVLVPLDAQQITGRASLDRTIIDIHAASGTHDLAPFAGLRAGGQLRAKLRELFADATSTETGLYLLLDDLAGATLVSSWAWFAWDGYSEALGNIVRGADISGWNGSMRGVCIGLRDGSSALDARGFPKMEEQYSAIVPDLIDPADPDGWHAFPQLPGASMRRARWIDVFREGADLIAECGFQDSGARPDGRRQAIHEYRLRAVMDDAGLLLKIEATPYVLPHGECPAAVLNLNRLVGTTINDLRQLVPQALAKEDGCTHLNDVVRALAGVPMLARQLNRLTGEAAS